MSEIEMPSEISDVRNISFEINDYKQIKPEEGTTFEQARDFWNGIFKNGNIEQKVVEAKENVLVKPSVAERSEPIYNESVKDFWNNVFSETFSDEHLEEKIDREGLTPEEKDYIKSESGWSDEIVDALGSVEEYEIYKEAGLVETEINGKKCLIRTDIDWEQTDAFGSTNKERVAEGYAPLDKEGKPIQLHHIGQHKDSPLAELTFKEHRTDGNDVILHDKKKETEVHGDGNNWDNERKEYWKSRLISDGGADNE